MNSLSICSYLLYEDQVDKTQPGSDNDKIDYSQPVWPEWAIF